MKKEDKYKGQSFPMYFQFTQEKDGSFIVDIRHTGSVLGITVHTSDIRLGNFKITEILEERKNVKSGTNYFNPESTWYRVRGESIRL